MLPRFEAARAAAEIAGASVWMAVPTMYHRLREGGAALSLSRLRLATSGSAALPASIAGWWQGLHGAIPLERYGMTEIGIALANPLDPAGRRAGTVGFPLPGVEIHVAGDDDGAGELHVRGPGVFAGYWGEPTASRAATADGWFATGDRARVDDDGRVRLLGRLSVDVLKCAGYKVS